MTTPSISRRRRHVLLLLLLFHSVYSLYAKPRPSSLTDQQHFRRFRKRPQQALGAATVVHDDFRWSPTTTRFRLPPSTVVIITHAMPLLWICLSLVALGRQNNHAAMAELQLRSILLTLLRATAVPVLSWYSVVKQGLVNERRRGRQLLRPYLVLVSLWVAAVSIRYLNQMDNILPFSLQLVTIATSMTVALLVARIDDSAKNQLLVLPSWRRIKLANVPNLATLILWAHAAVYGMGVLKWPYPSTSYLAAPFWALAAAAPVKAAAVHSVAVLAFLMGMDVKWWTSWTLVRETHPGLAERPIWVLASVLGTGHVAYYYLSTRENNPRRPRRNRRK